MQYVIPLLSLIICICLWIIRGKSGQGMGVVIAEYEPPLHLSPAEVGLLQDYEASDREITATLIDLAVRDYIAIRPVSKKKFFGTHQVYEFELKTDDILDLQSHEKELLNGLFGVVGARLTAQTQALIKDPVAKHEAMTQYPAGQKSLVGTRVSIDQLEPYFYTYVNQAKTDLYSSLLADGYFKSNSLIGGLNLVFAAVIVAICSLLLPKQYMYSLLISAVIFLVFSFKMRARTSKGQKAKDIVDGFALYLKTAELATLKATQTPKNVEVRNANLYIYDKFLPYAIALGLEDEWIKRFKSSYTEPTIDGRVTMQDVPLIVDSVATVFRTLSS